MVEHEDANNAQGPNNDFDNSAQEYLKRASQACASGDSVLGMHLYLAAFERASATSFSPSEDAIRGLKQAWGLSCSLGERSLAEYIFDKLEPYLTSEEVEACASQLQKLALDKLEEFGLSRDDLEDVADMISRDVLGMGDLGFMQVGVGSGKVFGAKGAAKAFPQESVASADGQSAAGKDDASSERDESSQSERTSAMEALARMAQAASASDSDGAQADEGIPDIAFVHEERLTYADLVGYNDTIRVMNSFGIGVKDDPDFDALVKQLNVRHGLSRMPAIDTLLFRSPAREDANRFALATVGELDVPVVRMRVEENLSGMPVLCVMAQSDTPLKLTSSHALFDGRGALLLEDIDAWGVPQLDADPGEGLGGFMMAQLSRGAREAINLVRSAVDNPDVYVIATASSASEIDPFFCDLVEPFTLIDIDYPTPAERVDIWMDAARRHPSLRAVDRAALVRYSSMMPRYDIYLAIREALEEAYKDGLVERRFIPVRSSNIFEKLACYQPLDSPEYKALEDAVALDFSRTIDDLEDYLKEMDR